MNMAGCCYICRVVFFPPDFYELGMLYTCPYFSEMMYIYEVAFRFLSSCIFFFLKGRKAQCWLIVNYEINCYNCNDQVGPKCGFFQWVDNETCKSDRERISMLENELQLANQREMSTREMEERANRRERETHELYVEAREKLKRVRESERLYKVALVLSLLFFIFIMLLLCFASMNNNVKVRNLNLPWCLGGCWNVIG